MVAIVAAWTGWREPVRQPPGRAAAAPCYGWDSPHGVERPASAGAATGVAAPILLTLLEVLDVLPTVDTFAYPMLLSLPVAIAALTVDTFAVVFVTRPTRTPSIWSCWW
jgi:hypothetical protein